MLSLKWLLGGEFPLFSQIKSVPTHNQSFNPQNKTKLQIEDRFSVCENTLKPHMEIEFHLPLPE